jgi:predicted nuclease with RNAse H fold
MERRRPRIAGVDYGSKLAGTTVIAYLDDDHIQFLQSEKKKDADAFLLLQVDALQLEYVFLDAPLSLPGVYRDLSGCDDYFYRKGDKELKAMSPMFLGGLTARAMRLAAQLKQQNITVTETYPGYWAKQFQLADYHYKKQKVHLADCCAFAKTQLNLPFAVAAIENWHQLDALLAFYVGWRYLNEKSTLIGDATEGGILV